MPIRTAATPRMIATNRRDTHAKPRATGRGNPATKHRRAPTLGSDNWLMSEYNKPYLWEIVANALAPDSGMTLDDVRTLADRHGIPGLSVDRAMASLTALAASGEDLDEWVRRQYVLDGWMQGYLQIDAAALSDVETFSTWKLGQLAYAHYGR